jgi:hypothetical protein
MADEPLVIRGINWRETLPFTHLFRTFRIAVHPSKLALALALLLLLYIGGRVMDGVWPGAHMAAPNEISRYEQAWRHGMTWTPPPVPREQRRGVFITFFNYEVQQVNNVIMGVLNFNWLGTGGMPFDVRGLEEFGMRVRPGDLPRPGVFPALVNFLVTGPAWLVRYHPVFFVIFAAWFLLVWSVLGGAIARIAAVHVARDEKMSVRSAVTFSVSKVLSFLFAPLIPLVIVLVLGVVIAIGGLLLYIPWAGPVVVGLIYFLALLAGFIMALVLVGTVGGLNLMFPTIAVEGSDSFDAISRSFSYIFARPWRMIWYTIVALFYGALCFLFVRLFIFVTLALTHFFTQWWLRDGSRADQEWHAMWPGPQFGDLPHQVNFAALDPGASAGAFLTAFWVYLLIGLLGAFAISFYFSANTIIYYLLRREVDATELDDVYLEQTDEDFAETPVTTPPAGSATTTTTTTAVVTETTIEAPPADEVSPPFEATPEPPPPAEPPLTEEQPPEDRPPAP